MFKGGMYAYAGSTDDRTDYFVLSSRQFETTGSNRLVFSYYLAGIEGRMRVCIDDLTECPFERLGKDIKVDSRRWQQGSVDIPAGKQTVWEASIAPFIVYERFSTSTKVFF